MNYFLKEQYEKTMTEISNTKNSDGLSGQDSSFEFWLNLSNCGKLSIMIIY